MRSRILTLSAVGAAALAIAASTTTIAGAATNGAVPTHRDTARVATNVDTDSVCYTQTTVATGNAIVSQRFGPGFNMFNSRGADDFVTTLSTACAAISIDLPGQYFNGPGPATAVQVRFFFDNSGVPGAIYKTRNVQATATGFTDIAGTFHAPWTNPVVLQPSTTYWVSARARLNFNPFGNWGWDTLSPQFGNPAVWKNPGNGFSSGCVNWQTLPTCFGAGVGDDFAFTIND